jgi:hypothetical protein
VCSSDLGNRAAARSDEIANVPEATGRLVVDGDASSGSSVPAARTSRTWEKHGHRVLRACDQGSTSCVPLPEVGGRALDRAIADRTRGSILLTGTGANGPAPCYPGFCCVDGKQTRSSLLPRSDGAGEFRKDRCEPVASVDIPVEFGMAAAGVLHERTPRY